jgi:hypothetical protein
VRRDVLKDLNGYLLRYGRLTAKKVHGLRRFSGFIPNRPLHSVEIGRPMLHMKHGRPSNPWSLGGPGTHVLGVNPQRLALGRASPARTRQLTR